MKNKLYFLGLFLIWPFIAVLTAMSKGREKYLPFIIFLFSGFVGLTFSVSRSSDVVRIIGRFQEMKIDTYSFEKFSGLLYTQDGYQDLFLPVLSFISAKSGFSDSFFLAFQGIIFGFFYAKIFSLVLKYLKGKKWTLFIFLTVLVIMLIDPIWRGINNIRFSLAVLVYVIMVLENEDYKISLKNNIGILFTPLIHFSMIGPVVVYLIYLIVKRCQILNFIFLLFFSTLFISQVNLEEVNTFFIEFTPEFLSTKKENYINNDYNDLKFNSIQGLNWYATLYIKAINNLISLILVFLFFTKKTWISNNKEIYGYFSFVLLYVSFANLISLIPSGSRMVLISQFLVFFLILKYWSSIKMPKLIKQISIPVYLLFITVQIRIGFDFMSIFTIIGSPLIALFNVDFEPLINYIK